MKKFIALLILSLYLGNTTFSNAQTTITVGNGNLTNNGNSYPCPYGNFFWGAKHDILILASELNALGMTAGDISSMAFNVASMSNPTTLQNFSIGIKSTTATQASSLFGTGFTTVVSSASYIVTTGWNSHTFSSPFYWDGTSNLLIETCFNNTSFVNSNPGMTFTTTGFQSVSNFRQDNVTTVCSTLNGTLSSSRPNVQLTYTPATLPPITKFGANLTNTCQSTISFKDSSCCVVTSWQWDFGDTTAIVTSQNPVHTYAHSGVYTVSLITTNAYGTDTLVKTNYITIGAGGAAPASCIPTSTASFGGFGITNVTFNTINNTSLSGNVAYEDFACVGNTSLYEGSSYALNVSALGAVGTQNFRAWIDYNNDGIFSNPSESVLSINNSASASANVLIPSGAVLNTPLRMRVAADYDFSSNVPSPCGNFDFGQAEDYTVSIIQNTNPPSVDFSVDVTTTCSGNVQFTDNSNNSPSNWDWDFGDNSAHSSSQNPTHSYLASGDYTVSLIATNAFGSDTLIKTAFIHVTLGAAPIAAGCSPTTTLYCCGYGIFNVTFGTISNPTGAGSESYQDFTCLKSTEVTEGASNLLQIQTGASNAQDTRVWIDYNNDGNFSAAELVLTSNNQYNPSAIVNVPVNVATWNTPLRMRVWSDFAGSNPGPCNNPNRGQVEDYTVIVKPNVTPPVANFSADITISCGGLINFTDSTKNSVSAWIWDFGDNTPVSNAQFPSHQYTATGFYTVTLIASSIYGSDTLVKNSYIHVVSSSPGPISASCSPATIGYCCGVGITNVTFNTINYTTNDASDGFSDYSCLVQTTVSAGINYPVSITTGPVYNENVRIWIDYNNDGSFTTNEIAFSDFNHVLNHTGTISIPANAITGVPLRMRVISDNANQLTTGCVQPVLGQVEDYGITILTNTNPPTASFSLNTNLTCSGIVNFTNSSSNSTSQLWDFGDVSSSTLFSPTHTYTSSGIYTVKLIVYNSFGTDTIIQQNCVTVTLGNGAIPAVCSPVTTGYCCNNGIYNVTLGTINNTTAGGIDSYKDYSCQLRDTTLEGGMQGTISVTTGAFQAENVRVYIDYNNNGNFNTPNELVYQNNGLVNHIGLFNVPSTGVVFYTNLRMRVMSDFLNITGACNNVTYGQVEDYTVFIKHTLGTQDLLEGESLNIFPNPSNGSYEINYNFEGKKDFAVSIADVLGRVAFTKKVHGNSIYSEKIDMSHFSKGIYILKITSDKQQLTRKIYLE